MGRVESMIAFAVFAACASLAHAESPEWSTYRQNIAALTSGVGQAAVGAALEPIMAWEHSLPMEFVRRGQSYTGTNRRLRRVVSDLMAGKPVEITVLGGSISTGAVASRKNAAVDPNDVWSLVRIYIQGQLSPTAAFYNNARSATKSYITSMCLSKFLNTTSDLVFVEFIANDGSEMDASLVDNQKARSFERFLRKIMAQPKAPAVVLMQMLVSEMAYTPPGQDGKSKRPFYSTPEDTYFNLAQYYDIPTLSFRDALWQLGDNGRLGHSWADFMGADRLHPNDLGHKVMADLVVHLLQQTALSLAVHPPGTPELATRTTPLPPPMFDGNEVGTSKPVCAMGRELTDYVSSSTGWSPVTTPAGAGITFGLESTLPGQPLVFELDTTTPDGRGAGVTLVYTRAKTGIGGFDITCQGACSCDPKYVDGPLPYDQTVVFMQEVRPTAAKACQLSVALAANSSAGSRVRISGVAVNGDPGVLAARIGEEKYMSWLTGNSVAA